MTPVVAFRWVETLKTYNYITKKLGNGLTNKMIKMRYRQCQLLALNEFHIQIRNTFSLEE